MARVASGNCGSVWSQTFTYDAFGNITKAGTNSFNPGYNPATNRMSSGATYDTNGDVLTDSLHSFAWDVETRPTTIDTVTATYDALGRMVEQTKSGISTEIQYAPTGFKMQTLNGQTVKSAFIPLPGGTVLVPQCECYFHGDWLGGSRFASRYSDRTMYNDLAYAPFGEQYATAGGTGVGNATFAGNRNDTTTNLYDAQFREYEITGRWPSPDPAGIAAANPANPQSWNRYAYALNSPLGLVDPSGLCSLLVLQTIDHDADTGMDTVVASMPLGLIGDDCGGEGSDSGGGGRGGVNFGHLVGQTLLALQNPNCAGIFGGYQNAVDAILNSSYNMYTPEETNPYPNQISPQAWKGLESDFATDQSQYGETFPTAGSPGGITFFGNGFNTYNPGFGMPFTEQITQETGFLHELEHASTNYYQANVIDGSGYSGDAIKLNSDCQLPQFETQSAPLSTTLLPPG